MPRDFPNARHPLGVERIIAPRVRSLPKDTLPYPQGNARCSGSGAGLDLVFSVRSCIQAPLWLRPCCSVLQQVGIFAALADYLWRTLSACRVDTRDRKSNTSELQ